MIANLARGAFLVFLVTMVVAYAVSAGRSAPAEPQPVSGRMYS